MTSANVFSQLSFWWISGFMARGNEGSRLGQEDMLEVLDDEKSETLFRNLDREWKAEQARYQDGHGRTSDGRTDGWTDG